MKKGDIVQHVLPNGQTEDFKIQWVIDNTASAKSLKESSYSIFEVTDSEWKVIQEATPSFQSQVCTMTDEELKASIEALRGGRIIPEMPTKVKAKRKEAKSPLDEAYAKVLSSMTEEQKIALRQKLGLV